MKKQRSVKPMRGPKRRSTKKKSLSGSDDMFRLVAEHVDDLIVVIDRKGKRLYASPSYARVLGLSRKVARADAYKETVPEDVRKLREAIETTLRTGKSQNITHRCLAPGGALRHLRSKSIALKQRNGSASSVLLISRDETELRESDRKHRLLAYALSYTKDCFCLTDLRNNFLFVNPAFCSTYGYTEAELLGKNISIIRSSDTAKETLEEIIPSTLAGGWNGELLNRRKDGSLIRVELWTSVVKDEEENPIALVGVARDITMRKHAEEEIRLLHSMTQAMNDAPDVQSALGVAIRKICEFTRWEMGQAWTLNHFGSLLECASAYFQPHPDLHKFHEISRVQKFTPGFGLPGRAWLNKDSLCVLDLSADKEFSLQDAARTAGFRSAVAIPIITHSKVFAVAEFFMKECIEMDGGLIELVKTLGMQLGSVIQRKQAEESLQHTISVLSSTLESTGDGILVVDGTGKVITFNRTFVDMWRIPQSILELRDDGRMVNFVLDQLVDPDGFIRRVQDLYEHPDADSFDILEFKDGRVIERNSMPQRINGKSVGRVWSFHDITERKQIEHQLIDGETKYRLLFESNPEAMWVYDLDSSRFLAVNEAAVHRYGYSEAEFQKMTIGDLQVAPTERNVSSGPASVEETRQAPDETQLQTKDGAILDVEIVMHPITFAGRNALLVIAKDVTGRRRTKTIQDAVYRIAQAGEKSQTLDELYRELHEIVGTVMPAKNFYIALYDEYEELLSFPYFVDEVEAPPAAQNLGRGLTEYVLRTGTSLLVDHKLDEELQRSGEVEMVGASSPVWLGVPLIVEHRPIGVMTVQHYSDPYAYGESEKHILEFVSSQIARAIDKKRGEEAMRKSEEKYRTLFEESKDGIFLSTREGKIIDVNPAAVELFGYGSKEEILKADIAADLYYNPADRDLFIKKLALQGYVIDFEFEVKTKNGERRVVLESASAITDEHNAIVAYRGFLRDITERKKLEDQLRHVQKMESIGTLAGGIAHDFNNLLGIILGYASLLESDKVDQVRAAQHLQTIKKAVERGAGLVRQLLTFARKSESWLESVNANETIIELEKMVAQTFPKTISIVTDLSPSLPVFVADAGQIHQAILNLCVNARDAIIERHNDDSAIGKVSIMTKVMTGGEMRMKFPEAAAEEYVVVSVSDTGIGMSEETKNRIFEPFFTTKELGKGTGLGLSVVYGVVKNHHGFIDVESVFGKGTTFALYFPVQVTTSEIISLTQENAPQAARGEETILVVEDEEMLLSLVTSLLQERGYRVIGAKDGQEGIEAFRLHHEEIACILTDMGLPRLGGWEMFLKMKEVQPTVKAILASGYCDPRIKAEMIKEGAKDFIQKPYVSEVVLQRIRDVIDEGKR